MTRRSLLASGLAALGFHTLVACGGDYAPAKSSASPPREAAPEPTTVEEAQKQIAQAVDELDGGSSNLKATETSKTPPAEPAAEPKPRSDDFQGDRASSNRCESPCRALASMKRAVEALCRMTGESDTKCVDARKTLAENRDKTASCKCAS